ncbi:predicted protein [Postia placenta Mad-698-R]|nr:predicted protein [Postia placenta Mad-698-R]
MLTQPWGPRSRVRARGKEKIKKRLDAIPTCDTDPARGCLGRVAHIITKHYLAKFGEPFAEETEDDFAARKRRKRGADRNALVCHPAETIGDAALRLKGIGTVGSWPLLLIFAANLQLFDAFQASHPDHPTLSFMVAKSGMKPDLGKFASECKAAFDKLPVEEKTRLEGIAIKMEQEWTTYQGEAADEIPVHWQNETGWAGMIIMGGIGAMGQLDAYGSVTPQVLTRMVRPSKTTYVVRLAGLRRVGKLFLKAGCMTSLTLSLHRRQPYLALYSASCKGAIDSGLEDTAQGDTTASRSGNTAQPEVANSRSGEPLDFDLEHTASEHHLSC